MLQNQQIFLDIGFVLALTGLALAIFSDHLQVIAKYHGATKHLVASGYNQAMKVMVVNRIGAVLYFVLLAYNIDNRLDPSVLKFGLGVTILLSILPTIGVLAWLQKRFNELEVTHSIINSKIWDKKIVVATFFATLFNLFGLTLPWIAGATFPEWRLTLANTSFIFNTIFTVINVFYIENRLAYLIDTKETEIHGFVAGVIIARKAAFIFVGLALISL